MRTPHVAVHSRDYRRKRTNEKVGIVRFTSLLERIDGRIFNGAKIQRRRTVSHNGEIENERYTFYKSKVRNYALLVSH